MVVISSNEYLNSIQVHSESKKVRSATRNDVLESQKGTPLYNKYIDSKKETDRLWDDVLYYQSKEKFLAFKSFQQFLGEFGWAFGLFIYSLFNIIAVRTRNKNSTKKPETILHVTLLGISLYHINWCLMPEDYDKSTYVIWAIIFSLIIVFAVHLMIKVKISLYLKISNLVSFILKIRRVYITDLAVKAMDSDEEETINTVLDFENETKRQLQKIVE